MDGIHHLALRVRDCLASARFYELAFGLREIRRFKEAGQVRAVWFRLNGGVVLMLERSIRGEGRADGSGHVLVFAAADLVAEERRLRGLGIAITDRTPSTIFVVDPDGHRAGLSVYRFVEQPVIASPDSP